VLLTRKSLKVGFVGFVSFPSGFAYPKVLKVGFVGFDGFPLGFAYPKVPRSWFCWFCWFSVRFSLPPKSLNVGFVGLRYQSSTYRKGLA
jgi:hypothetical protein